MIPRLEFAKLITYLEAVTRTSLPERAHEPYYDLLSDIPLNVLQAATKVVALSHYWTTFPSIAELRQAATTILHPENAISSAEAWQLAWKAACATDPDVDGSTDRACRGLPPMVIAAMKAFGIPNLAASRDPVTVLRAQFLRIYESLTTSRKALDLLPKTLADEITCIQHGAIYALDRENRPTLTNTPASGTTTYQELVPTENHT